MSKKIDKSQLAVVPWRDFVIGFQVAGNVLEVQDVDALPDVDLTDPTSENAIKAKQALKEDPYLRVLIAIRNHFGQTYPHLPSFIFRYWALMDLLRRGHITDWVTTNEEGFQSFHPAVLLAAAETKLTNAAKFPPNRFRQRVTAIIAEETDEAGDES